MTYKNNVVKIGEVKIKQTAALAPMAGITDKAFRELAKKYGASYVVTEMVSAKALCYGDKKTERLLDITDFERPVAIQLFGFEPQYLAKAAYICLKYMPDIIDINMGCPARKITNNNSGAALMKDIKLVGKIAESVVKSVGNLPVTVKIRSGWDADHINAVEIAKVLESNGVSAITIHGRTRQQMYLDSVSLDIIMRVKRAVKIPVIGNGDIIDINSAIKMYNETGCDLIMIGRGSLGNPWIFQEIDNYFNYGIVVNKPTLEEKINVMKYHLNLMLRDKPEEVVLKEARKHIGWYIKGFRNAAIIRSKVLKVNTFRELDNMLDYYIN